MKMDKKNKKCVFGPFCAHFWPIFGQNFENVQYFLFVIILFKVKQNGQQRFKMCFGPFFAHFWPKFVKFSKNLILFYCSK